MNEKWVPKKPNFGPPPAGYVAGLGRGATGFVTRSDLGPAARANNIVQLKHTEDDEAAYADNRYDSWQGYKGALFTKQQLDDEDKQADEAFDFCERRMEERRLQHKQRTMKEQLEKQKKEKKKTGNMPISEQYTDLKRDLAKVTEEEWLNLPEAVDLSIKKRRRDKYTPVPDAMIVSYLNSNVNRTEVESIGQSNQNFRQAKEVLLKSNLEKAENQVASRPELDRIGYLTSLDISKVNQQMLGDIKRARLLHKAALASNPKNADVWLSAARIEQIDGKLQECRNILHKALEHCPLNEDIWIELSRVEKAEESKNILIEALRNLPKSEKIWLTVAKKESSNKETRSKILRKGLENIPDSAKLWKQLIELSDLDEAKNLLYKAVQCLPKEVDLWIGLAKLQSYENAKQVLNKARKANPLNLAIWISAAKLEETQSDSHEKAVNKIEMIITKGRETLKKNGNTLSRDELLQQALICERSSNLITCQSIVKSVISLGLIEEELNYSIFKDVDLFQREFRSVHTTRFLYKYGILQVKNPKLFQKMLEFQERLSISDLRDPQNKKSQLMQTLKFGLKTFPENIQFWLAMIDRLIDSKSYDQAQEIIQNGVGSLPADQSEKLYIKKSEILMRINKMDEARKLLQQLKLKFSESSLAAVKSVWLEYHAEQYESAWKFCSELFKAEKKSEEIWELALRIKSKIGSYDQCKNIAEKAVSQHSKSIKLWKLYIAIEVKHKFEGRARTVIDKALMKNPKNEELYLSLINLEISQGSSKQVSTTLARALKDCPKSGQIWAIAIMKEGHNTRKKKASIAIEQCGNNSYISCAVAKLFWKDNKLDKARKWLQDSIHSDKTNGDMWAYYYKFIKEQFSDEVEKVKAEFVGVGKITHGRKWMQIKEENADGWKLSEEEMLYRLVDQIGDQIFSIE